MGDTVATTENGYECVEHIVDHALMMIRHTDQLIDEIHEEIPASILTALCADAAALGLRLRVFALQYKEQLECISIDQ